MFSKSQGAAWAGIDETTEAGYSFLHLPFRRCRAHEHVIGYALNAVTSLSLTLMGFLLEDECALAVPLLSRRGTANFCSDTVVT